MPSLADAQANFVATINEGPAALDPSIFSGPADRVILGLRAHANTISHARLVALENTFPRCREAMGDADFNRLSRDYCETASARALDSNAIGAHFAEFLGACGAEASLVDLAKIELLWLASYDAAEADHLALTDLAGLSETDLLELTVTAHPAANILSLSTTISTGLPELREYTGCFAILTTRPEAMPVLTPLSELETEIFAETRKNATVGNLLELSLEQGVEEDALAPLLTLINAGSLVRKTGNNI